MIWKVQLILEQSEIPPEEVEVRWGYPGSIVRIIAENEDERYEALYYLSYEDGIVKWISGRLPKDLASDGWEEIWEKLCDLLYPPCEEGETIEFEIETFDWR